LTAFTSNAANTAAIEIEGILNSPLSYVNVNSAIQDFSALDNVVFILDPSLTAELAATTVTAAGNETYPTSIDRLFTTFSDLNDTI